jgi:hypothetical protein
MTRITTPLAATLCGFGVLAGIVSPALAADVRAELTPELIYDHCLAAGVGSETEATFMLPGGRRVTGSVLCTAEDLVAAKAGPSSRHRDDGDDHDEDEDEDRQGDAADI